MKRESLSAYATKKYVNNMNFEVSAKQAKEIAYIIYNDICNYCERHEEEFKEFNLIKEISNNEIE